MPNHVENYITIRGSKQRIDELREAVKNDEFGVGTIDFEKLISRPKELEITSGSDQTKGLKAYQDFIDVYTFANGGKELDLLNIPEEKEIRALRKDYNVYSVRPGITGWAQINGRDSLSIEEKALFDKEYIDKQSILFDIKILFRTVLVVLKRENIAEGGEAENKHKS